MDSLHQGFIPSTSQIFPLMTNIVLQDISELYTKSTPLTICALESGDAKSELLIIDQVIQQGYTIRTIILVDIAYKKPSEALLGLLESWKAIGRIENYFLLKYYDELIGFMDKISLNYVFTIHPNTTNYKNERFVKKYASTLFGIIPTIRWFMNGDKQELFTVLQQQKVTVPAVQKPRTPTQLWNLRPKSQRSYRISPQRKTALISQLGELDEYQSQSKQSFKIQESWIFELQRRRRNINYLVQAGFSQKEAEKYCDFKNLDYDDDIYTLTEFRRWVPDDSLVQISTLTLKTADNLRKNLHLLASRRVMTRQNHTNTALWNSFAIVWTKA
jgi:hypothetical protein